MNIAGADELSEILDRVRQWSPPSRITLARRILESLDMAEVGGSVVGSFRGVPVEAVVGLLRTDQEPPGEEECRRIVEEERWRKFGP